ncbi:MAG: hypothetical protein QME12_07345 [Nanoarchaeota archaeon]|nr:hypothetical protein [Nanoarchaeota archaeon]
MEEEYEPQRFDREDFTEIRMLKKGALACSGKKMKDGNISTSGDDPECLKQLKKELL